jgi:osmotically-inducible protein OsmY
MHKQLRVLGIVFMLAAGLQGCADFKCAPEYCASDTKITADVHDILNQHSEFGAPGTLKVQTINGVVYLNGRVNTALVSRNIEALVREVTNVKDVVNSLTWNAAY